MSYRDDDEPPRRGRYEDERRDRYEDQRRDPYEERDDRRDRYLVLAKLRPMIACLHARAE